MGTILGFDLCYYAIVGGRGMRRIEGRIVSMVDGETIVCIATSKSTWKRKETIHKSDEALLYSHSSK